MDELTGKLDGTKRSRLSQVRIWIYKRELSSGDLFIFVGVRNLIKVIDPLGIIFMNGIGESKVIGASTQTCAVFSIGSIMMEFDLPLSTNTLQNIEV